MEFDISDREREQLAKQSAKAAAAYMDIADGLNENNMFNVALAVVQASIVSGPVIEQLTSIYVEAAQGTNNE